MTKQNLIKKFKENGYEVINVIRFGSNGYPDYIAIKNGRTILFECKKGNDTLKKMQEFRIDFLNKSGFTAFAVHEEKGIIYPENYNLQLEFKI